MAYFPFMIDIGDKQCLVVGGGSIALHKVKILADFGVHIKVVAPQLCQGLQELSGKLGQSVVVTEREFQEDDIVGMSFVVAATDDMQLNYYISELCRQKNIPVNAVDMKEACTFIFPAMIKNKDLLICVSSGGQSPAAVAHIKKKIQDSLPDYYGDMIETIGEYRNYILDNADTEGKRKEIFNSLLEYGDTHEGVIPKEIVEALLK